MDHGHSNIFLNTYFISFIRQMKYTKFHHYAICLLCCDTSCEVLPAPVDYPYRWSSDYSDTLIISKQKHHRQDILELMHFFLAANWWIQLLCRYASLYTSSLVQQLRADGLYIRPLGNVIYLMCSPCTSPHFCSQQLCKLHQRIYEFSEPRRKEW